MTAGVREALSEELCAAGLHAARLGLSPGASGNLSVRDDETMIMSPSGVGLGDLTSGMLVELDAVTGTVLAASGARPSKEAPLHAAIYARFAQARAIVHLHSPQAVAFSCRNPWSDVSAIPPLTPYLVMRVGRVPLAPYAPPGTLELARTLDDVAGEFRAVLLARHGLLTWGTSMAAALDAAIEVEEGARTALLAGPDAAPLPDADVTWLARRWGTPFLGE